MTTENHVTPQGDPVVCIYKDQQYSVGATSCQNGSLMICQNDGTWAPTGGTCDESNNQRNI